MTPTRLFTRLLGTALAVTAMSATAACGSPDVTKTRLQ
jgi:hypothetical protein